jgi:hypothetical protein
MKFALQGLLYLRRRVNRHVAAAAKIEGADIIQTGYVIFVLMREHHGIQ